MLTKVNHKPLIEVGRATRFGPNWPGKRCLAKTRRGTPCQKAALKGKTRCRLHGGLSIGPRTPEGKARSIAAHTKHGRRVQGACRTGQGYQCGAETDHVRAQAGWVDSVAVPINTDCLGDASEY